MVAVTASEAIEPSLEDAVLWSYRLLLGREPENAEVVRDHAKAQKSVSDIRRMFLQTEEFAGRATSDGARVPDSVVLAQFPRFTGSGEAGSWFDFLGVKTRCDYLPQNYAVLSGQVEGPPGTERAPLHDVAEWIGTLRSVLDAQNRGALVVVELGAGWGPWLVGAAKAAQLVGIRRVKLVGVEGAESHFKFMLQHFRDNGLDPAEHNLIHGVIGAKDGVAYFPKLLVPHDDWGSAATFDAVSGSGPALEEVRCVALTTLLGAQPFVDLIHCDIQGAEHEVLSATRELLQARVRRVVVGTHSRRVEADLMDLFVSLRWRLEDEGVCKLVQSSGNNSLTLVRDGFQVWVNPHIS